MKKSGSYFLEKLYSLPVGIIEFVKDERGTVTLEMANPEVVRILASSEHIEDLESLNPFNENNERLQGLQTFLEDNHIFTVIGGSGNSRYIIFIDKSRQKI